MFIYRPNAGYHGSRKRPTRAQRVVVKERIEALLTAAEDTTTQADASRDLFVGTVDADFEMMDEREVHIGSTVITFGLGASPYVENREAA